MAHVTKLVQERSGAMLMLQGRRAAEKAWCMAAEKGSRAGPHCDSRAAGQSSKTEQGRAAKQSSICVHVPETFKTCETKKVDFPWREANFP